MLGRIVYRSMNAGASGRSYGNICRDLSIVNAKNYEHTTRDGHVKGYLVNYSVVASDSQVLSLFTPMNSWHMRNSFRKFHAYRDIMFDNAGVTDQEKGRYGHTIRPYLNNSHRIQEETTGSILKVGLGDDGAKANGGEWTYSRMSSTPLYTFEGPQMKDSVLKVADEYPLLICGDNVAGTQEDFTSGQYAAVAMINSYNLDRQDVVTATTDGETIQGPKNPLAALRSSGNQAAGEILEITNDLEKEKPPYDLADDGDTTKTIVTEFIKTPTTLGVVRGSMFLPAGVFEILQTLDSDFILALDVVAEVLCKDMA
jgi:hypothetical protein